MATARRVKTRQDLNRKGYQPLFIYWTKTAQNSQFSPNSESLVRSALHFLMGSPATRQGHEKLVYRLIHLFSSTEIFSKRRKICSCSSQKSVIPIEYQFISLADR